MFGYILCRPNTKHCITLCNYVCMHITVVLFICLHNVNQNHLGMPQEKKISLLFVVMGKKGLKFSSKNVNIKFL